MDDFGFGPDPFAMQDPFAGQQFDEDDDVVIEIEQDLGKSYISERVAPSNVNNSLIGQTYTTPNGDANTDNAPNIFDETEEKQLEITNEELFHNSETNNHKPLQRSSRKRKRAVTNDSEIMDLSSVPNAKRVRKNTYISMIKDTEKINDNTEIYLHGRPSLNDTSFMITDDTNGEQLYIYYDSYNKYQRNIKKCISNFRSLTKNDNFSLNKLGIATHKSVDELLDEIEKERIESEIRQLENIGNETCENILETDSKPTQLWTDKYAPHRVTELLSSEKINREVTQWVKQWDYIVFGHKYTRMKHSQIRTHKPIHKKPKQKNTYSIRNNIPVFGRKKNTNTKKVPQKRFKKRPEISVLLFCGAPGTGKSTLAHIVANHCGYRPFEINASNDRNGKKVSDLIINAATMKPMFGDTRPPLIIMDEIDGAINGNGDNKSCVDVILKIVRDANAYYNSGKKKRNLKIVNRPIICICNNEYSRALRPLRQIAKIYKFKPIRKSVLCKRLLHICREEYIHSDMRTLSYLAQITNNDIRSCLHTLQFFKQRSNAGKILSTRLNINLLQNVPIGRKDKTQNIFDVWSKILKKKKVKKTYEMSNNSQENVWKEICVLIYQFGGNDSKIIDGICENYLKLGYTDPLFRISFESAQWIRMYDELKQIIDHSKNFSVMAYLPFAFVGVYENCATQTFQKLEYPSAQWKHTQTKKENRNTVQRFLFNQSEVSHSRQIKDSDSIDDYSSFDVCQYASVMAKYYNINACAMELMPLIPYLIFSNKRWNNSDFDKNAMESNKYFGNNNNTKMSNKRHFVSIIKTMIECGLNYLKADKSSNFLELKPPIHKLSIYAFNKTENREKAQFNDMKQFVKHKIAHQIVLEIMRRNEAGSNKYKQRGLDCEDSDSDSDNNGNESGRMTPFMSAKQNKKTQKRYNYNKFSTPSGNGKFGLQSYQKQSQTPLPGFTPSQKNNNKNFIAAHTNQSRIEKYEYPIQYKYVEGYTNAVKRKSFCRDWM